MPRVTVIIPTYNWSTVLPYSIGSVLRQTMTDFEVFVVGDGCTDDSAEVVEAMDDPRVRWHNMAENMRDQAYPNQYALEHCDSEYVSYLNHDDLYMPHALEVLVSTVDRGEVCARGITINILPDGDVMSGSSLVERYRPGDFMTPSCVMHRLDVALELGGWIPWRISGLVPQQELWNRFVHAGHEFRTIPRLVSIKFPAARRKDVYVDKPCHEQREYTERILSEPDLEQTQLARMLFRYQTDLARNRSERELLGLAMERFGRRLRRRVFGGRRIKTNDRERLESLRRFKGLDG